MDEARPVAAGFAELRCSREDDLGQYALSVLEDVVQTRRTLELLVESNQAVLSELSLPSVLRRIVGSARELARARYAALGVVGPTGVLEEFVHDGIDDATVARMAHLPTGRGLLGVLIDDPRPVRVATISEDPRSTGFPAHHPRMERFLGVPVIVRGAVFGHLYLTERVDGEPFDDEDESVIGALAVSAGIAIDKARMYEDSRRRQHWAEASARITAALLDPGGDVDAVGMVADTVLRLNDADVVSVVVPGDDASSFTVELARGRGADELVGLVYPAERSVAAAALRRGCALRVGFGPERDDFVFHVNRVLDVGAVMAVPLHGAVRSHGVLVVARLRERPSFEQSDLDLSESFAAQAAVALELAQARQDQQSLALLQDRERIARDLHDHVIQRLFASGLSLEVVETLVDEDPRTRVAKVVEDLNVTIRQIRDTIFRLQNLSAARTARTTVLDVVATATPGLGFRPLVAFDGPVDTLVDASVLDDLAAVTREALSNVARHAHATTAVVRVRVALSLVQLVVTDDGTGVANPARRSGLRNLEQRASDQGGEFEVAAGPRGGTEVRWSIPLR